ncbi:hypothetical protein BU24DRAFT_425704 [Aaosphaeria arxii CBS 175.79]|uniref:Uncharacterized protein n=1 Tax=Aaosphaeria arxii CBS 175.79 TaxID=1450172 RepID=A0A6A5XG21_9PLEO|nr:uncharacterized protein BU24DRAFT_425704 [Aaosphaeria arxii CBS 175.79]KAF2011880.1 hypothetical protein BU24DRAFT_425704 [Aaosphaeria arxii CBS 175.79]
MPGRTVFIAVLPGRWTPFNLRHKGTAMFNGQAADYSPPPAVLDPKGDQRWVVGVFRDKTPSPTWSDFIHARYFQCRGELGPIRPEELEVWEPVGETSLSNVEICDYEREFWQEWRLPAGLDWKIRDSQDFSLFFSFLIIEQASREANRCWLITIHKEISRKQRGRLSGVSSRRSGANVIAALVVIYGIHAIVGLIAFWCFDIYTKLETMHVVQGHVAQLQRLVTRFPEVRPFLLQHDAIEAPVGPTSKLEFMEFVSYQIGATVSSIA